MEHRRAVDLRGAVARLRGSTATVKRIQVKDRFFYVDDADYEKIRRYRWGLQDHRGYIRGRINGRAIYLHRFIMNAERGKDIDHINGNPLDNRRENLRIVTRQQNLQNGRSKHEGYKGTWLSPSGKWLSAITHNYRFISLGTFETEKEAALAYDVAALTLFGKYARTNFKLINRGKRNTNQGDSNGIKRHNSRNC